MDGCGEAGETQGILDGSNFVATSSDLACKGHTQKKFQNVLLIGDSVFQTFANWTFQSHILSKHFFKSGLLCLLRHNRDLCAKLNGNGSYQDVTRIFFLLHSNDPN